uniref:DNA helicase n=1 Tax=Panagrellus redivivus TaxID=6233 RepID=A0A7E5A0P0_PANRE
MSSADDTITNLRRSDRQRKLSKRVIPPYEAERYKAPKKRPGPKSKPGPKPKTSSSTPKLVPLEGPVDDDDMPESELTGFLREFRKPAAPAPKPPKLKPTYATTSQNSENQDDDIQVIGVRLSTTPKMAAVPRLVEPRVHAGGVLVAGTRMVRFRNCSTDKPEIHIQSADFPDYDHVYIAENKRWASSVRFYCAKEFDRMLFAEMKTYADGSFQIYEYGKHRNSCCIRSKYFVEDTVRFLDNMLFVKVPETQTCTINEDQSHLTVHHPRGDFAFVFSRNLENNEAAYNAECGCQAQAILTEAAVWVNYYHNFDCPFRPLTRAPAYRQNSTNNNASLHQPGPALVDLSLPSDLNNSRWLASFSRYHELPVDGHVAHVYWNRVDISQKVEFWKPSCELWPLDTPSLIAHLLIGSPANARQLERFFKSRFLEHFDILNLFENVDYRKQHQLSPFVQSVIKFDGYCSALLEFVARYFEFRLFVIKNGADFRRYGNWHGAATPVATINCIKNGRYEIVVGMKGIYK